MKWLERIFAGERAHEAPRGDPARVAEVERVLAELRPLLAADGGEVRLVEVVDDAVVLAWDGACRSCGSRADTLRGGIEPTLRARLPWLAEVRTS